MPSPDPTPTPAAPTAQHHANLAGFLNLLERLSAIALTLAPVVAAPFARSPQASAVLAAEAPVAQVLAQALADQSATKPSA